MLIVDGAKFTYDITTIRSFDAMMPLQLSFTDYLVDELVIIERTSHNNYNYFLSRSNNEFSNLIMNKEDEFLDFMKENDSNKAMFGVKFDIKNKRVQPIFDFDSLKTYVTLWSYPFTSSLKNQDRLLCFLREKGKITRPMFIHSDYEKLPYLYKFKVLSRRLLRNSEVTTCHHAGFKVALLGILGSEMTINSYYSKYDQLVSGRHEFDLDWDMCVDFYETIVEDNKLTKEKDNGKKEEPAPVRKEGREIIIFKKTVSQFVASENKTKFIRDCLDIGISELDIDIEEINKSFFKCMLIDNALLFYLRGTEKDKIKDDEKESLDNLNAYIQEALGFEKAYCVSQIILK